MTEYVTPICFTIAIICISLAIFKFNFLSVTPIALQRIVDRMSDSYIVLNENNLITDFNIPFLSTFRLKEQEIRNISIFDWSSGIYHIKLKEALETVFLLKFMLIILKNILMLKFLVLLIMKCS